MRPRLPWTLSFMEEISRRASSSTSSLHENHFSTDLRGSSTNSLSDLLDEESRGRDVPLVIPWAPYIFGGAAGLTSFAYGFNSGIISVALVEIEKEWNLSSSSFAFTFIVTSMLGGAVLGSVLPGWIGSDRIGRRPMLVVTNLILILGALGSFLSRNEIELIFARIIVGLGIGLGSIIPSLYITEMAPGNIRGTLGILNQFSGFIGILASYCTGLIFSEEHWQRMFLIAGGVALMALLGAVFVLPESPRWLINHQRNEEGLAALSRIYGKRNYSHFTEEFEKISTHLTRHHRMRTPNLPRKTLFTIVALQFIQQAAGSGFITYYSATIFKSWGLHGRQSILATIFSALPQLLVFGAVAKWAEVWGRKRLLLTSEAVMGGVLLYLGIITYLVCPQSISHWQTVLIFVGLAAHRVAYALGLAPVPTVLIAEILPFHLRSHGLAISLTLNWFLNFLVTSTIPLAAAYNSLSSVYLVMASLSCLAFFFISRNISETRGLLLEATEEVHLFPVIPADPSRRLEFFDSIEIDSKPLNAPPIILIDNN